MFKVVIADDEVRVCRLVQMLADWDALDMEVVGTASNGLEALELIKAFTPDILITDIRMPGCDGLELIEKAKQIAPGLEIIIISGYAQFEYAQTAIRYDVSGYLLKPIKKPTLMATLTKLSERLRERSDSNTAMEHLLKDSRRSHDLLRDRLVENLVYKHIEAPTREQLHRDYGFPVQDGLLLVFILKVDYDPDRMTDYLFIVVKNKVQEVFGGSIMPLCLTGILQFHASAGYGILNYAPQKHDEIRRALRQFLNLLEVQKPLLGSVEFSLAIGSAVKAAQELPASMRDARCAIGDRLIEGTGRLLQAVTPTDSAKTRQLLNKYGRTISHAVDALNVQEADKAVDELLGETRQSTDMRGCELFDLVLAAGRMFALQLNAEEERLMSDFMRRCDLCSSAEKLFSCLRQFQREQIEIVGAQRENEAIRPIRIAKQYIQRHYNEPITLEDVCAATGFSVSYFSTMFKKETGEGFSKYLTRVRVEQAKTLLQDTNLSITEICERVGYSDLKHFTGTFKKLTSLNPAQYRKLYG